jgi:hypothetical protein
MTPTDKIRLAGCLLVVLSLAGLWLMRPKVRRHRVYPRSHGFQDTGVVKLVARDWK